MNPAYWVVRPNPDHTDRMEEFLKDEIIAIGWPHLSALDEIPEDQLFGKLQAASPNISKRTLKMQQNMILRFCTQMKPEDLVIVPTVNSFISPESKATTLQPPVRKRRLSSPAESGMAAGQKGLSET